MNKIIRNPTLRIISTLIVWAFTMRFLPPFLSWMLQMPITWNDFPAVLFGLFITLGALLIIAVLIATSLE